MSEPPAHAQETPAGAVEILKAVPEDIESVASLVSAYHAFEGIEMPDGRRRAALSRLLGDPPLGEIRLIRLEGKLVGYLAICFGYSIEFAGRDAFLDEFFLIETARGKGIGGLAVEKVAAQLADAGIVALHLEVGKNNRGAQSFYRRHRFQPRAKYQLMSRDLTEN